MTNTVDLLVSIRESSEETFSEEVFGDRVSFKSKQCGGKRFLILHGTTDRQYLEDFDASMQLVFLKVIDPDDNKLLRIKVNDPLAEEEPIQDIWVKGGVAITSIYITNDCGNEVEFYLYAVGAPVTA